MKNYDGDTIIKEGELIKMITSVGKDEDDGGRSGTDKLPIGYYAVDKNAKYLYKVVEEVPPTGYALYPTAKQNTAYIPNLDYLNSDKDTILNKLKEINPDTLSSAYDFSENTHTFAFTNDPQRLGRKRSQRVCKRKRPSRFPDHKYVHRQGKEKPV